MAKPYERRRVNDTGAWMTGWVLRGQTPPGRTFIALLARRYWLAVVLTILWLAVVAAGVFLVIPVLFPETWSALTIYSSAVRG